MEVVHLTIKVEVKQKVHCLLLESYPFPVVTTRCLKLSPKLFVSACC